MGTHVFDFETGKLARFASGAVVVGVKGTKVLVTAVSNSTLDATADFLPLSVEYREKQYAKGKIPNTYMRREGAPKERELLCGRVIDRSLRPLFPKGYFYDTQITANVLCSDGEQDPDILAINAASAALMCSDIPWNGPVGAVRIGRVRGTFVVNPDMDELAECDLSLTYACTETKTMMIEAQAREITNKDLIAALKLAHEEAVKLIPPQLRLSGKLCNQKRVVELFSVQSTVVDKVRSLAGKHIQTILDDNRYGKFERGKAFNEVEDDVRNILTAEGDDEAVKKLSAAFEAVKKQLLRENILRKGLRVDGRSLTDVRSIYSEAALYPTSHGSALFSRGNTQVLCTVTLGPPEDAQKLDSLVGPFKKLFMVHYSFPPFSINEVGRFGALNRREVGHGTLAEKALIGLLPPEEEFTYSIRVNSDVMASDGSTSMATVCGGSLALMDAGVPIERPVAGVSMGLASIIDPDSGDIVEYKLLTDILGLEDHMGDMDFKIAGTKRGVTAIQLDIKPQGIPLKIVCEALKPALRARCHIIDEMNKVLSSPREQNEKSPRGGIINIDKELIRVLIGPSGSTIKSIQTTTGARVYVNSEGAVSIFAANQASYDEAKDMVDAAVGKRDVEVGATYKGVVVTIKDFGAFVELKDRGFQGLLHISELAHHAVSRVGDVVSVGEELSVVVIGRDIRGNLKLSRKALLSAEPETTAASQM